MTEQAFKGSEAKRSRDRERQSAHRARRKLERQRAAVVNDLYALASNAPSGPDDAVEALAAWARDTLKIPPGHPHAGRPLVLPDWMQDFLRKAFGAQESALCVSRKNGKSALCATVALGHLVGPLRVPGFRAAVASISKEKAAELRNQVEAIALASGLDITVRRSPNPGTISSAYGKLETLSSDRHAGHSSSFDLVLVDETGLLPERARDFVAGLRSSISAKGGRIIHISIRGDGPMMSELLDNPTVPSQIYAAPSGCELDDRDAWHAANPGLSDGIKQISYLENEAERVRSTPGDEATFRAYDLNQHLSPSVEMICDPSDLTNCFVDSDQLPERLGDVYVGFDIGEATSATAAVAIWPLTGRTEFFLAFGAVPDLATRGRRDDAPYLDMQARGELRTYPGRVVKPSAFLGDLQTALSGSRIARVAADSYKDSEIKDWIDRSAVRWQVEFRRVGAGKDGSSDVRSFQRLVLESKAERWKRLACPCYGDHEIDIAARRKRKSRIESRLLSRSHRLVKRGCYRVRISSESQFR